MSKCFADGCTREIPREHLMCSRHWYQVPEEIRNAVNRTYRSGDRRAWAKAATEARKSLR